MLKQLYTDLKKLKIIRLRFPDPALEVEFQIYYTHEFLPSSRIAIITAMLFLLIFGILDYFMLPQNYIYAWIIRFLILFPFLLIFFPFTYTKVFLYFWQFYMCLATLFVGLGISLIIYFAAPGEPAYQYYYSGLLLVIMFVHTMIRVQIKYLSITTLLIIAGYGAVAVFKQNLHTENLVVLSGNFTFLFSMEALSIFAGITIEYYQRKDFLQKKAINNRRKTLEAEIETATRIQQSILPGKDVFKDKNITIAARYLPMVNIGGDFYDYKKIGKESIGLFIADVSGHGVSAALIASMVKMSFHSASARWQRPDMLLKKINEDLYAKANLIFITAAYLCINFKEKKCAIAQAGHPPLLVHNRKNGLVKKYKPTGFPLGVFPKNRIEREIFNIEPEDRFLLYTDGLYETLEHRFAEQNIKMATFLKTLGKFDSPDSALNQIESLLGLPHKNTKDDITMVIADIHQQPNSK